MSKLLSLLFIALLFGACEKEPVVITQPEDGILYYCSKDLPNGTWQVYRTDFKTNKTDTITNDPLHNYWWVTASPDGSNLLLLRSPATSPVDQFDYANCDMLKCDADGANQTVIIEDNQNDWNAFGNPHWHPNGDRILMIAQSNNDTAPFFTYTVDGNGNNPQLLIDQYSIDANWNKAGDRIAFVGIDSMGFVDATSFEVFTAEYDDEDNEVSLIQQLTSDNTRNHDPCFSPDGTQIAFSASNTSLTNADLVTIDLLGENRTDLLNDNGVHGGPLNWGDDDRIYNHSIYIGSTGFTINAFNTISDTQEVLLSSIDAGYISPYYVN